MTTSLPSKQLSTWDASKQQRWRQQHPDKQWLFHFVLDASPSMCPYADALVNAYNLYLRWLQRTASPMSMAETRCFSLRLQAGTMQALGSLPLLTRQTYRPEEGDGTALYNAIGDVCSAATQAGQHVLVLFTDGQDCAVEPAWTAEKVNAVLTTLQEEAGWLCVFLGAFFQALRVAEAMGFHPGNTLEFPNERIPEAFATLKHATQRYLTANAETRKLLAAGGIF
jgi:hypothetical protein